MLKVVLSSAAVLLLLAVCGSIFLHAEAGSVEGAHPRRLISDRECNDAVTTILGDDDEIEALGAAAKAVSDAKVAPAVASADVGNATDVQIRGYLIASKADLEKSMRALCDNGATPATMRNGNAGTFGGLAPIVDFVVDVVSKRMLSVALQAAGPGGAAPPAFIAFKKKLSDGLINADRKADAFMVGHLGPGNLPAILADILKMMDAHLKANRGETAANRLTNVPVAGLIAVANAGIAGFLTNATAAVHVSVRAATFVENLKATATALHTDRPIGADAAPFETELNKRLADEATRLAGTVKRDFDAYIAIETTFSAAATHGEQITEVDKLQTAFALLPDAFKNMMGRFADDAVAANKTALDTIFEDKPVHEAWLGHDVLPANGGTFGSFIDQKATKDGFVSKVDPKLYAAADTAWKPTRAAANKKGVLRKDFVATGTDNAPAVTAVGAIWAHKDFQTAEKAERAKLGTQAAVEDAFMNGKSVTYHKVKTHVTSLVAGPSKDPKNAVANTLKALDAAAKADPPTGTGFNTARTAAIDAVSKVVMDELAKITTAADFLKKTKIVEYLTNLNPDPKITPDQMLAWKPANSDKGFSKEIQELINKERKQSDEPHHIPAMASECFVVGFDMTKGVTVATLTRPAQKTQDGKGQDGNEKPQDGSQKQADKKGKDGKTDDGKSAKKEEDDQPVEKKVGKLRQEATRVMQLVRQNGRLRRLAPATQSHYDKLAAAMTEEDPKVTVKAAGDYIFLFPNAEKDPDSAKWSENVENRANKLLEASKDAAKLKAFLPSVDKTVLDEIVATVEFKAPRKYNADDVKILALDPVDPEVAKKVKMPDSKKQPKSDDSAALSKYYSSPITALVAALVGTVLFL